MITGDVILDKIEALLNMTEENGCTEHEAANAAARVQRLVIKHNIDLTKLTMSREESESAFNVITMVEDFAAPHPGSWKWQLELASTIVDTLGCDLVYNRPMPKRGLDGCLYFVGNRGNCAASVRIFNFLIRQMIFLATNSKNEAKRNGENTAGYLPSYLVAMCHRVRERLRESHKETMAELGESATTTMLAVASKTSAYVAKKWPKLRSRSYASTTVSNSDAYNRGKRDASKVKLNQYEGITS